MSARVDSPECGSVCIMPLVLGVDKAHTFKIQNRPPSHQSPHSRPNLRALALLPKLPPLQPLIMSPQPPAPAGCIDDKVKRLHLLLIVHSWLVGKATIERPRSTHTHAQALRKQGGS